MKRIILAIIALANSCLIGNMRAQTVAETEQDSIAHSIALQEVEVRAARVVNRVDGKTLFPSKEQKDNSPTGYSLLGKLSLTNIRVDEALGSISALNNKGEVQVRINGAIAKRQDLQAIDVKNVARIEFIDNPGVRYGTGIGYVIDIRTRRGTEGYSVGADLMNTATSIQGSNDIFASYNKGKGQLRFFYENSYQDLKGARTTENANYLMEDGSLYNILREDTRNRSRNYSNVAELKYSLADTTAWMFQASLTGTFSNSPRTFSEKMFKETGKAQPTTTMQSEKSNTLNPVLDLYFFRQITPRQTFTTNAVGTYISTKDSNSDDEGTPYSYQVDGKTHSLIGEAIYEN